MVGDGARVASGLGAAGEGPGRANVAVVPTAEQGLKNLTGQHTQGKLAITLP